MTTALWERTPEGPDPTDGGGGPDGAASPGHPRNGTGSGRAGRRRRLLRWGLIAAVVVVVGIVMTWRSGSPVSDVPLDPRNPQTTGAQALARVLGDHGVEVVVARGRAELAASGIDSTTTVFVVSPDPWVLRYLSPEVDVDQTRRNGADLTASCDAGDVRQGERISHSQSEFQLREGKPDAACFTTGSHSVYLAVPATAHHAPLVLLGSRSAVTNDEIGQADNAAIVLRALGHSPRVVWYVPSASDIPSTDESRTDALIPAWVGPGLVIVLLAVLALMLWRGRRLGRLVREPLPVVIRAIETTESRGRIYRRAKDTGRAGVVLRDATRHRLAGYLGLPVAGPIPVLVVAVATATGRPYPEIEWLLAGPPPPADDDLLGLAGSLAALEKEVRHS